jgi:hypothetical protein
MTAILTAREMLRVKTLVAYRAKQRRVAQVAERIEAAPIAARVEQNRWLLDCVCGSGVAVHPAWPEARCMGANCGRVYPAVVLPGADVVAALEALPPAQRYWYPGEAAEAVADSDDVALWQRHLAHVQGRA